MAKKRILITGTIVFILITMVSATYAWFVNYQVNKATGYDITINGSDILQVSLDGENFYNTLDLNEVLEDVNGHNGLEDLSMIDVTGDGVTFLRPELIQNGAIASPDISNTSNWIVPENGKDYLSFKLYFRSNKALSVYLGNESIAEPVSPVLVWEDFYEDEAGLYKYNEQTNKYVVAEDDYTGKRFSKTDVQKAWNRSGYGPFSKDCIVGASRVSFVDTQNNLQFIWIPNSTYVLDDKNWVVNINNSKIDTTHKYYDNSKTLQTSDKAVFDLPVSSKTTEVTNKESKVITLSELNGEFYTGEVLVNIWLEGCDNEARRALSGGKFNVNMQFVGIE